MEGASYLPIPKVLDLFSNKGFWVAFLALEPESATRSATSQSHEVNKTYKGPKRVGTFL